jgi:uncharacterized membrane protein HdeD (DUF308 family)
MYSLVLILHSWIRWAALVAGVGATVAAFGDRSPEGGAADRWGFALVMALDLQLLLGLLLYFAVSPNMAAIRDHFGEAMQNRGLRFWAVEHVTMMLAAVVLAHVGRVLARKAPTPGAKRSRLLVCFGLSTILMLAGIPWPGLPYGRPLFRLS